MCQMFLGFSLFSIGYVHGEEDILHLTNKLTSNAYSSTMIKNAKNKDYGCPTTSGGFRDRGA